MIKGYLVILNGNCKSDLEGIYTVFVPTISKKKAIEYVAGNGDIINAIRYDVDLDALDKVEKSRVLDRIDFFKKSC